MTEISDVKDRLIQLAEDVLSGNVDRADAAVVSQILNVYLRAVSVGLKAKEVEEVEARLEELEEALQRREKRPGRGGRLGSYA